ncbi:MAG: hypothetical protein IKH30_17820, partial [Clostridia bacterium]|nr:hypothetical protein [Clostridia bacterium]
GFGRQSKDCSPSASRCSALFMRRLLVSADLTADDIPATGGHRRFVPVRFFLSPFQGSRAEKSQGRKFHLVVFAPV